MDNKTKEAIFADHANIYVDDFGDLMDSNDFSYAADEYAEQEGIAFADWLDLNSDENDIRSNKALWQLFKQQAK